MDNSPNIQTAPAEAERAKNPEYEKLLEKISSTDIVVYELLNYANKDAKDEFLANPEMSRPNFEYDIDEETINANLATIQGVYNSLDSAEGLSRQEELTLRILTDENAKRNAFVRDTLDYNAAETPEEKSKAAEAHKFSGEALYGRPDEAVFTSLLKDELGKIKPENLSDDDRKTYESLLEEIGDLGDESADRFRPKPETVEKFSTIIHELFGKQFFRHIPEDKDEFTPAEACEIAAEIIREEIGEDATQYRAVMDDKIKNCSVNHLTREIKFPVERATGNGNFSRLELQKILVHELGTHAYRAAVYEDHEVSALSREMPGNEEIDEGIAKCCEQAVAGKFSESGVDHYINIGLATFKGKTFREVFEIQQKLLYLKGCKNPAETPEEKSARFHAKDSVIFNRTARCFRGTGELPNNKDLVYYNGAVKVWQFIEANIDDPDLPDKLFLSGKIDITSPDQERLIYETKH